MSKIEFVKSHLIEKLNKHIGTASTIYMLTSFVMKSGVEVIKEPLQRAAERGADIKICAGDYLYVTQPEALRQLIAIHPNIEVRLWKSNGISFHPKAYLFENQNNGYFIIGSSNLSRSALTSGVEWSIGVPKCVEENVFAEVMNEFLTLFYAEQTVQVNAETLKQYEQQYDDYHQRHTNLVRQWTKLEEVELMLPTTKKEETEMIYDERASYGTIQPRFAQVEALAQLEATYEEGYDRAMVVMATGLGKTYLAAFFARKFQRVLFVAHREEILHQAKRSFAQVLSDKTFGIYDGKVKEGQADVVFASIFTLSMKKHLTTFAKDAFDLIVNNPTVKAVGL